MIRQVSNNGVVEVPFYSTTLLMDVMDEKYDI